MTPLLPKPEPRGRKPPKRIRRHVYVHRVGHGTHSQKVRKANELWRLLIYGKEPSGICPRCQKRPWHDAAHFFAKGPHPTMRFELDNGAPLCRTCHRRVDSDHIAKTEFFWRYLGPERYARLELMAVARQSKQDLTLTIMYLQQETAKRVGLATEVVGSRSG